MIIPDKVYKYIFSALLTLVFVVLLFVVDTLSISYKEALNVFINNSLLSVITKTSIYIFGQNDFSLRVPFMLFYFASVILMYLYTDGFFKNEKDRFISSLIFMVLPGLLSASILVNSAIIVTFLTILYLYYYKLTDKHNYILLVLFLFVDNSFAIFFLALFFYAYTYKDKRLLIATALLFVCSMLFYGFDTGGKPRGFLVDTFGIYASIFSPLLFIYFFYSVYREGIKGKRDIVWFIATTSLVFSLLFSFRQRIYIEDFAPFVVIFLPYMIRIFFHSLRVRLPQFRYRHYYVTAATLFILFLTVMITLFNKPLYLFLENPKKHFAYKYNIAKEIAYKLKENNINYVESSDKELLLRLKFYGIRAGTDYYISTNKQYYYDKKLDVVYLDKEIASCYIIDNK